MMGLQETAHYAVLFFATELSRYVIFALAWLAVLRIAWRWAAKRKIQPHPIRRSDFYRDGQASLLSVAVYAVIAVITLQLLTLGVLKWQPEPVELGAFALTMALTIVAHDAYFYWTHRWMHHRRLFRAMHSAHHLARTPSVWSSYSFSAAEAAVQGLFIPIWLVFVPMNELGVAVFFIHQLGRNVIGHSGHELAWPGFTRGRLTGWITTTTHHDLHHSEGRYNFGLYFTWWDKLMGTEHPRYHERFEANARPRASTSPARRVSDGVHTSN